MKTFPRLLVAILLFNLCNGALRADNGYNFDVKAEQKKVSDGPKQDGKGATLKIENWSFVVTMDNHSFKDVPACVIKYVVFVKPENGKEGKAALGRAQGSVQCPGIVNNGRFTFTTDPVEILVQQLKDGYVWSGSGQTGNMHDKMRGIWFRVYVGDQVVYEFINPKDLASRGETFDAPPKQ